MIGDFHYEPVCLPDCIKQILRYRHAMVSFHALIRLTFKKNLCEFKYYGAIYTQILNYLKVSGN